MNASPRYLRFALLLGSCALACSPVAYGQEEPRVVTTRTYTRGAVARDEAPAYNAQPAPQPQGRRLVASPASNRQVMSEAPPAPASRNPYARPASYSAPGPRQMNALPASHSGRIVSSQIQGELPPPGVPMTSSDGTVIMNGSQGGNYVEGPMIQEGWEGGDAPCSSCGGGGCNSCGGTGCGSCCEPCYIPCPQFRWENVEIFAGVQGFKNERNAGRDGSFGFHEGFNWAQPMPCFGNGELATQFGLQGVHSNFAGAADLTDGRDQLFLTTGIFRRVDWGLQGGVVYDYMSENWQTEIQLSQVRGEISWVLPCRHEFGFWFATNVHSDLVEDDDDLIGEDDIEWTSHELYAFFYRRRFESCEGAEGRLWGGFTGESDGLFGGDIRVPINRCWTLAANFNYVIPNASSDDFDNPVDLADVNDGTFHEAWNVGFHIVWTPQGRCGRDPYVRPLFGVADNGTFIPRIGAINGVQVGGE